NFQRKNKMQESMYQLTFDYLKGFKIFKDENEKKQKRLPTENFGFIAVYGEQHLKDLPIKERAAMKNKHNNYGIGKTHLQIALAKRLIKDGFNVLVVSDTTFI